MHSTPVVKTLILSILFVEYFTPWANIQDKPTWHWMIFIFGGHILAIDVGIYIYIFFFVSLIFRSGTIVARSVRKSISK